MPSFGLFHFEFIDITKRSSTLIICTKPQEKDICCPIFYSQPGFCVKLGFNCNSKRGRGYK